MKAARWLFVFGLAVFTALAQAADEASSLPELPTSGSDAVGELPLGEPPGEAEAQARTMALADQLRCPVCQGLSVGASPSEAARAMRDRIESLVRAGYTDDQVRDYFVYRYGTWVLLEPPREGLNWVLWAAPAGIIGIGAMAVLLSGARRRESQRSRPAAAPSTAADPYRAAVLAELEDAPQRRGGEGR